MMKEKRKLLKHISDSNKEFVQEIKAGRGWDHFGRAITAKILWITFLFSLQKILLPEISTYNVVSFLAGCGILTMAWEAWDHVFKEHCPGWVDDLISGRIFFKLDIKELDLYIAGLAFANLFLVFLPKIIALKLNLYEKK